MANTSHKPSKITAKKYKCTQCGHIATQSTNHYGPTWSWGHYSTCPNCPPYKKYPEFGGQTIWECIEKEGKSNDGRTRLGEVL